MYRRALASHTQYAPGEVECLLVNTTGELIAFYSIATVVFVGKSLYGRGGQNPIEPAGLGKPVIFGPYMDNFAKVADEFIRHGAAVQVSNEQELLKRLIDSLPQKKSAAGLVNAR